MMHSGTLRIRPTQVAGVLIGLGCLFLIGCSKPLLTADEERSQFQRYERVRGLDAPSYYMDEFGRRRPNLRGRLKIRE